MSNKWHKFWQLGFADQRLLMLVMLLLPLMTLALRAIGFRRLQRELLRLSPSKTASVESTTKLRQIAGIVDRAARNVVFPAFQANCLIRSLILWWLLRRRGIAADLRIGVRKSAGELQAHAWVEHQGQVLNDAEDVGASYSPFEEPLFRFGSRF